MSVQRLLFPAAETPQTKNQNSLFFCLRSGKSMIDYSISKADYTFHRIYTHMKKIFLPFLALCGMITGLTLTSCGGGGGGGATNMAGMIISVQSGVTYDMVFGDKVMGSDNAYYVTLVTPEGDTSPVTADITAWPSGEGKISSPAGLIGLKGSLSADTYDYDDMELFFNILAAGAAENEDGEMPETQTLYAPATFHIQAGENFPVAMQWTVYMLDAAEEEEDPLNPPLNPPNNGPEFIPFNLAEHNVFGVHRG
jgi:hypothetical protein